MGIATVNGRAAPTETTVGAVRTAGRLYFVDNIRIYLTILVILHHLMVVYAGSGSWLYNEGRQDEITAALGAWFCAANQAYFMSLFLLISAYFVPGSYDRKGAAQFLKDRLIRLGLPLVLYSWIVRPLYIYLALVRPEGTPPSFWTWYRADYFRVFGIIGGGPLWFIETLLIFSFAYVLWRWIGGKRVGQAVTARPFPGSRSIVLFAMGLAMATFFVRLWFPVNESFTPLNLQIANFAQYIALFGVGLAAYRHDWLVGLPARTGRRWLAGGVILILIYPLLAIGAGAAEDPEPFMGGWHWQSLTYALWESFVCLAMCLGLIYLFRRYWDHQGRTAALLSRNAYGAYLVHEPVVTTLALLASGLALYPLLKFGVGALLAIVASFGLSMLMLRLPYANRVL